MAFLPPSQQPFNWSFRRVVWATLVIVLVALSVWALYRFNQVVFLVFIAIVLGTVVRPVAAWFHRRKFPLTAAAIVVYLLLFVVITGFVILLFPLVANQSGEIVNSLPSYYQGMREWLANYPNQLVVRLGEFLPITLPSLQPVQQTGPQMLATAGQILGYFSTVANTIFAATAVLLLAFYWTLYGTRTIQSLLLLVPADRRENISDLISVMETKLSSYLAGQAVLCAVIGVMALVAYLLIGLPNTLVLALVAGMFEAVPMVGPILGAVPAAIIALSIAPSRLIWVLVATIVIQQLENSLLVPRIHRKSVGVNPFVSLLAIFAFSSLFGIIGALMAIPLAAIIQLLLDRFVFHSAAQEPEVSTGRDLASRLRYEAQELALGMRTQARISIIGSDQWIKQTDQVMDEIEAITTDLDSLLAEVVSPGEP
jgi:predicted PurR-regulated permease PerM